MPDILNSDGTVDKALLERAHELQDNLKAPPISDEELAQDAAKIKKLFADKKVGELYKAERVDKLQERIFMLAARDHENFDRRLKNVEEIFDERRATLRSLSNVARQKYEIRKFELSPGEMNVVDFMSQVEGRVPIDGTEPRWRGRDDIYGPNNPAYDMMGLNNIQGLKKGTDYGDAVGRNTWSWIGGSEDEIRAVQNRDTPIIHTRMPPKSYRNIVFDTEVRTLDEIKVNSQRLENFLETGIGNPLTEAEKKKLNVRNQSLHRLSNVVESVGDLVHQTVNWAGKGIIHKSKAADDDRYRNYLQKRSALLAQMAWSMGNNSRDGAAHTRVLKAINDVLQGSDDVMDQAIFAKMQTIITNEIKAEDAATKEELEDFNKKMQSLNKKMLDGLQGQVNTEDEMWKYRVLQVFLLVTPLGAFSVAGQLFNYLDPLIELIGPIFDAHTSLSEGIASMTSSKVLGPFGKIAEFVRLDEGIEIVLDKTPILSDLLDVVDYALDSNIVQSGMATAAPLKDAPLVFAGIAAVNSFFRFDAELTHHQKTRKFIDEQEKTLEDEIRRFQTERESGREKDDDRGISDADALKPKNLGLKKRLQLFAEKRFTGLKEANLDAEVARFVADVAKNNPDILDKIFQGLSLKDKEKDADGKDVDVTKSITELQNEGKLKSSFDVIKLLEASSDEVRKGFLNKVMVLERLENNKSDDDLAQYIFRDKDLLIERFGDLSVTGRNGVEKKLSDLHKDGELNAKEDCLQILAIADNDAFKKTISRDCVLMNEEYKKITQSEQQTFLNQQITKMNNQFIIKSADAIGIRTREKDDNGAVMNYDAKCKYLESEIKEADAKYLFGLAQERIPSPTPTKPTLSPLNGQTPFFNIGSAISA